MAKKKSPFAGMIRKIPPLFPDQKKSVERELKVERVMDLSEPGTGKTRVRIEVFAKRRVAGSGCALVFAPKSLLRAAWEADAKRYAPWMGVSCAFASNREEAFEAKADMYVTNHDAVKWVAKQPPSFFKKFDYLVIDESDAFKHHTSQRSKALNKIKKHFKYRCIMNGVPTPNGVCDIWNQANIVDDGKRLGTSFFGFRAAVCTPEQVGPQPNMVKWIDRPGAEEQVALTLKDISLRNTLKGVPANHKYTVPFYMDKKHMAVYDEMEREAIVQLQSGQITAVNAAAVSTKLLQIASGAVYDENGDYHVISPARYELIADLIEARRHTVVFFLWTHQRDLLIEQMKKRGLTYMVIDGSVSDKQRLENVQMYEAGMFRTCFLHPKSAAHGLTLVRGKATIWPSPTHDLAWWLQGNKRIDRTGQTEETETLSVLAQGTYEEKVYARMGDKNVKLIDLLRSIEE
jgi:SNF2 family DNA or RNA helicase